MAERSDWLDKYMRLVQNTEPPIVYHRWVAISTIAAVLQRKCWLEWGDITVYPNLYVVLVGPSGKCRKGTAMKTGQKLLDERGIRVAPEALTREQLIRELRNSADSTPAPDNRGLVTHCSLTVLSAELTVFLGYNNYQLMSDLADWYDCADVWRYHTKTSGDDNIEGVWVNLIGATTPELVQSTLPRDAVGGGLTSRIIFVYAGNKAKKVPAPFLSQDEQKLKVELGNELDEIHALYGPFKITEDFVEAYAPWYMEHEKEVKLNERHFGGYIERRQSHLLKLCMIVNASRTSSMVIDACDFKRARNILLEVEETMSGTFRGVGSSPLAEPMDRIMRMIALEKQCLAKDIMARFYSDITRDELGQILAVLESSGFAKLDRSEEGLTVIYNPEGENRLQV